MNTPFGKTKRVTIKGEWYTLTQVTAGSFYVHKDGAPLPGYLVKLPSSCDCPSRIQPCKHIPPTQQFFEELNDDGNGEFKS